MTHRASPARFVGAGIFPTDSLAERAIGLPRVGLAGYASPMATRWLYTPDGKPAYYEEGKWLYSHPDSKPTFYIEKNWVYTREGKPSFLIEDNWLYEHPAGRKSLYFE